MKSHAGKMKWDTIETRKTHKGYHDMQTAHLKHERNMSDLFFSAAVVVTIKSTQLLLLTWVPVGVTLVLVGLAWAPVRLTWVRVGLTRVPF